jgi:hypothetical protein
LGDEPVAVDPDGRRYSSKVTVMGS